MQKIKDYLRNNGRGIARKIDVIVPKLIVITAIIGFVVAFVSFVKSGGYVTQLNMLGSGDLEDIPSAFTKGTVDMLYGTGIITVVTVLFGIQFVAVMFSYFKEAPKTKSILMIISLVATIVFGCIALAINLVLKAKTDLSTQKQWNISGMIERINDSSLKEPIMLFAILILLNIILFLVLIFTSNVRKMFEHGIVAVLISYVGMPLLLLLLMNIVPLLGVVVVVVFALIMLFAFVGVLLPSGKKTSNNTNTSRDISRDVPKENTTPSQKKYVKEWVLQGDIQFWVDGNVIKAYRKNLMDTGYDTPIHYSVAGDLYMADFESGAVVIKVNGKTITKNDLHYGKK